MGKLKKLKQDTLNKVSAAAGAVSSAASSVIEGIASLDDNPVIHYGIQQPFEIVVGNPAMFLYRTAKVAFNLAGSANQVAQGTEFGSAQFSKETMELSTKFYNMFSALTSVTGYDMGRYTAYDPDALSPKNDGSEKFYYSTIDTAERFALDIINNTGFVYDIKLTSPDSLTDYIAERRSVLQKIKEQIQKETSRIDAEDLSTLDKEISDDLKKAQQELNNFKQYLTDEHKRGSTINPSRYIDYFKTLSSNLEKAIEMQLKADKTAIDTLCDKGGISNLKSSLKKTLEYPEKKDNAKKDDEVPQTRLEEMKKKIAEDNNRLQQTVNQEMSRISFLTQVYKQDPEQRKHLEQLAGQALAERKKQTTEPGAIVEARLVATSGEQLNFQGIKASEIKEFRTETGVKIRAAKDDEGKDIPGAYSIKFPHRFSFYYHSLKDNTKFDMTMLVKTIKANNPDKTSIIMNIKHNNPDHARFLALKAFEACRDEGFDESKITINVNGKEMPLYDKMKTVEGKEQAEAKGLLGNKDSGSAVSLKRSIDAHATAYQGYRQINFDTMKSKLAELKAEDIAKAVTPEAPVIDNSSPTV